MTFSEINSKSPINHSTAKMRYSFPKTERFNNDYGKNKSRQFLFNIPEVAFNHRAASIGYGKKSDFTKVEDYKKASFTDTRNNFDVKKASHCYTFGASRSVYEKVVRFYIYIF